MRAFLIYVVGATATLAVGADSNYFPLAVGNRWEYSVEHRADHVIVEVLNADEIGGKTWFRVRWLDGADHWLHVDARGRLIELDRAAGADREQIWVNFTAPPGVLYETRIAPCVANAKVVHEGRGQVQVRYPSTCVDGGLQSEIYADSVGLKQRIQVTFKGPETWTLVSARIGGRQQSF
jgi:hypothetical protein